MDKYIGFDIDDKKIVAYITNTDRDGRYETLPMCLDATCSWLAAQRDAGDRLYLTFEVSGFSGWLYDNILPYVDELVVCNPTEMTWIYRTRKKSDRIDACKMARLYMMGMLPKVHVPSYDIRQWRLQILHRRKSVNKRTSLKNQIRMLLKNHGFRRPEHDGSWWSRANRHWMWSLTAKPTDIWKLNLVDLLEQLELLEKQVDKTTRQLDQRLKDHPGYGLLNSIKGVGPRTIEAILAYTDDVSRFESGKQFASYFGLTPRLDQSGQKRRDGHISKQGPSVVRWLIVESSWRVVRCCRSMQMFYERVLHGQKSRKKIAIVAVARKLLMIIHAMLNTGEEFNQKLVLEQEHNVKKTG